MIAVAMRYQNMGDRFTFERPGKHAELIVRTGSGIDDGDLALTDHVEICPLKGKRSRIIANNPPQARGYRFENAILESHLAGKKRGFRGISAQHSLEIARELP